MRACGKAPEEGGEVLRHVVKMAVSVGPLRAGGWRPRTRRQRASGQWQAASSTGHQGKRSNRARLMVGVGEFMLTAVIFSVP